MTRGPLTWLAYLLISFFTYLLNIQGNIMPFLQAELELGYAAVSLHPSATAVGMVLAGLTAERVARVLGRGRTLALGGLGASAGAVLLCMAPAAWASIASCLVIGALGALIPCLVPALLAEAHGANRHRALAECGAMTYAFAIMAPLMVGLTTALGLGWRVAMLAGAAVGCLVLLGFRGSSLPAPPPAPAGGGRSLPAAYWAYWCLLTTTVSIEFCILLWAPAFLERAAGLPQALAAVAAAGFSIAMLLGRLAGSGLVRRIGARSLIRGALIIILLGFIPYWAGGSPLPAVGGLFVLGLGTSLLYPLTVGLAIDAAGERSDVASARFMLAVGIAILSMPAVLGALADRVGLHAAHLVVPVLVLAAAGCLVAARGLERRDGAGAAASAQG